MLKVSYNNKHDLKPEKQDPHPPVSAPCPPFDTPDGRRLQSSIVLVSLPQTRRVHTIRPQRCDRIAESVSALAIHFPTAALQLLLGSVRELMRMLARC